MTVDSEHSVEAVVCIPTFRRPDGLEQTLRSLLRQATKTRFAIVVVENDADNPVGAERARAVLGDQGRPFLIVAEGRQGNCHAINRAFLEARTNFPTAPYFLMIDDDEIADPNWLDRMAAIARDTGADIVGGPVVRRFEIPVSSSIQNHPLNGYIPGPTRQVPIIHGTGNCLIRRRVFSDLDSPSFDVSFNYLGGGDMDFFVRCRDAGFLFWWCEEAVIHETVLKERANAAWLLRRSIRTGAINYVIDRKRAHSPLRALLLQAKNLLSLCAGVPRALAAFGRTGSLLIASHPLLMPFGRFTASLGKVPTPYKAAASSAEDVMNGPRGNEVARS